MRDLTLARGLTSAGIIERMPPRRTSPAVAINLAIVYLGWGSTYLAIRIMVRTIPPLLGAGLRFLLAGLIMLAIVRLRFGRAAFRFDRRALASATLVGLLLPAGGNGLVTIAERNVPSGLAALLVALEPVWVVVAVAALGQRPSLRGIAGVGLGFAGVAVLFLPGGRDVHASTVAMLVVVLAALSWAVGSVASGRLPMPPSTWAATGVEMLAGGLAMTLGGLALGETGHVRPISTESLEAIAYLVLIGSLVTFSAYVWLLRSAPIGLVSTYAFVNPLVAVALGAAILSEPLTPAVAVAAVMIVAGVVLTTLDKAAEAQLPAAEPEPQRS